MSNKKMTVASKQPEALLSTTLLKNLNLEIPTSLPIEEAVIGAFLMDVTAYDDAKHFLPNPQIFSVTKNQSIFRVIQQLRNKNKPIDLLTVNEALKEVGLSGDANHPPADLTGKKLANFQKFAVSPLYLVELTNRVASTANTEYHAAILYQNAMRRTAINKAITLAQSAANMEIDIFETYDDVVRDFRSSNPAKVIKLKSMNDAMKTGREAPPSKWVAGNLFKENEVCFLFADAGDGKSVLAFQIADAISKGEPIFRNCNHPDFINQCEPKLTYFYDFELEEAELFGRYSINGEAYNFSENFIRGQIDPNFLDFENADELIAREIQRDIELNEPEFVVIDNLTYIIAESQDSAIATKFMKRLLAIQRRSKKPVTIIVIAHTPKRDPSTPILMKNLAGSMNLANFSKSIVAISKSAKDPHMRYIKHIKCRSGIMMHGNDNVIECLISKNGTRLEYEFMGFSNETDHLQVYNNKENEELAIEKAYEMRQNGTSFRDIAAKLKKLDLVNWSYATVTRKLKNYKPNIIDPLFDDIDAELDESDRIDEEKAAAANKEVKEAKRIIKENTDQAKS